MKQMMKQMGMEMEPLEDVERIVITTAKGDWVFDAAEVVKMTMQGSATYQITGQARFVASTPAIPESDVALVREQTGASEEAVRAALDATGGDIAEAIVKLSRL